MSQASPEDVVIVLCGDRGGAPADRRTDLNAWKRRIESAVSELTTPTPPAKLGLFDPDGPEK